MRILPVLSSAALAVTLLAGCSDEPAPETDKPTRIRTSSSAPSTATSAHSESPGSSPSVTEPEPADPDGPLLEIVVKGSSVQPNAQEMEAETGQIIYVSVESDRSGQLHVHAKPEQFLEFGKGVAEIELVIDTPGSVQIEEHETGSVVARVDVR